ncbi:hypothetical protein CC79DRAFT_1276675 [Sarocladium strictum]
MKLSLLSLAAACIGQCTAKWTNDSPEPIERVPAPWTLKGTIYGATFIPLTDLPTKAYGPLERKSVSPADGEFLGGLGMIQVIRYTESPVGPYDELLIVPGFFKHDGPDKTRRNVRITRIYVSQKYTCWNGRTNWNIPKHLARFDWTEHKGGSVSVKVYPHDTTGDPNEEKPSEKPFFQATFKPNILGGLPFTTDLYNILGVNTTLTQPPLPAADSHFGELAGTDHWAATIPGQKTSRASLQFFDMRQGDGDVVNGQKVNAVGDEYFPNFWPGLLPFHPGMKLEDATITFSDPEIWEAEG